MSKTDFSIKNELICRGSGKAFFLYKINCELKSNTLELTAFAGDKTIPADLLAFNDIESKFQCSYVVAVVPQVQLPTTLAFTLLDKTGQEITKKQESFSAQTIKWKSRFAYRTKPELALKIRNYDEEKDPSFISFHIEEMIPYDESLVIHASIRSLAQNNLPIKEIAVYSDSGEKISHSYIELSESRFTPTKNSTIQYSLKQFSVRVKRVEAFYLAAINAKDESFFSGFRAFEKSETFKLLKKANLFALNAQVDPAYDNWFHEHKATPIKIAEQKEVHFPIEPLFSIVVPLYETPIQFLIEMIHSVTSQSYKKWELILVNASPDNNELKTKITELCARNPQLVLVELEHNLGISLNTAEGIKHANGDYICFFDHDDLIEPDLLFEYTQAINNDPSIDVLYCDEDKLLPDGYYSQPLFKPNFSIDLLRNNNYICHMLTIKTKLMEKIPITTDRFDGAQDHELVLRASEFTSNFCHIPRILYHWRMNENSTAANAETKPYATIAGIDAVSEHLKRLNIDATVEQSRRPFTYNVTYEVKGNPLVSIIIPNKDHIDLLEPCISSIVNKTNYSNYEIIVVENNSIKNETFEYYSKLQEQSSNIKVVFWEHEFNFSKLINYGASQASGEYYLLLNNDTEVITPSWIKLMLGHAQRKDVGAVGVRLYYKDDTVQHAGLCVTGTVAGHLNRGLPKGNYGYFALSDATQNLSAVTAACMMTSRKLFEKVHGFTEELAVAFNDVDYCLKIREQQKLIVYTPEVELYHCESISRGQEDTFEKKMRFHEEVSLFNKKWAKYYVLGDPYINPNFDMTEPFNRYYRLPHFE